MPANPDAVVGKVEVVHRQRFVEFRIDDRYVGVAPGGEGAFLGVYSKDLRGVGRSDVDEAIEGHAAFYDALGVGDADSGLDAVFDYLVKK